MPKYHNCKTIPASVFFEVIEKQDFNLLKPALWETKKKLQDVFDLIYDEYFVRSQNREMKDYLKLNKDYTALFYKYESFKQIFAILWQNKFTETQYFEIVKKVNKVFGTNISLDYHLIKHTKEEIRLFFAGMEQDLEDLKIDLKDYSIKHKNKVNFETIIFNMSSAIQNHTINENMSLAMFIEAEKRMLKLIQEQKK